MLSSVRGKARSHVGGRPKGRFPVMRVRQAAPVGSADADEVKHIAESVLAGARVAEPCAPSRRHRAGVLGPMFPPVCWRSNRLYYRNNRVAGAHAHDVGQDANGWVPVAWSGRRTGLPGSPEPRVVMPWTTLMSGLAPVVLRPEPVVLLTPAAVTPASLAPTRREQQADMVDSARIFAPPVPVPFPINGGCSVEVASSHELDVSSRGLQPALQSAADSSAARDVFAVVNGTCGEMPDEDRCAGMKRPRELSVSSGVCNLAEASINGRERDVDLATAGPDGFPSDSGCCSIARQPVDGDLPLERAECEVGAASGCGAPRVCDPQAGRRARAGAPAIDLSRLGAPQAAHAASLPGSQPTGSAVPQQVLFVSIHQYHPVLYPGYELAHDGISSGDAVARVFTRPPWAPSPAGWELRSSTAAPVGGRVVAKAVGSHASGLSSHVAPGASAMLPSPEIARPGISSSVPQLPSQDGGARAVPSLPAASAQARAHVAGPTAAPSTASSHAGASALKPRAVARVLRQVRYLDCC